MCKIFKSFAQFFGQYLLRDGPILKLHDGQVRSVNRKFVIPDNVNNTTLTLRNADFYGGKDTYAYDSLPYLSISKKADNTKVELY